MENSVNVFDNNGWLPLYYVARDGYIDTVKYLIKKGADINLSNKGLSAIGQAASFNHWDIVELLARRNANVNVIDNNGWTPLFYAAKNGPVEIVQKLIESGADIDFENNGLSALHLAASNGRWEVAKTLIILGADVNIKNENEWTPLYYAARDGSLETVETLIRFGAHINLNDGHISPLDLAASFNQWEVVNFLYEEGAKIEIADRNKWIPIYNHVKQCSDWFVRDLVKAGADIYLMNGKMLCLATSHGNWDVVNLLLEAGAFINVYEENGDNSPICIAAKRGPVKVMQAFMNSGADINLIMHIKLLNLAKSHGNWDVAKFILKTGAIRAARNGTVEDMQAFIKAGAEINLMGGKLLLLGATYNNWNIVKLLLKAGASVNLTDIQNKTPLHYAVKAGVIDIVQILIKAGASLGIKDKKGRTPLQISLLSNKINCSRIIIKYLVLFNSDPTEYDSLVNHSELIQYCSMCTEQIEMMKHMFLANTKITFLKMLREKENKLANYFSDENINFMKELRKVQFRKKLPLYSEEIEEKFSIIKERVSILKRSKGILEYCFPTKVPPEITRKILGYLNDHDLKKVTTFSNIPKILLLRQKERFCNNSKNVGINSPLRCSVNKQRGLKRKLENDCKIVFYNSKTQDY